MRPGEGQPGPPDLAFLPMPLAIPVPLPPCARVQPAPASSRPWSLVRPVALGASLALALGVAGCGGGEGADPARTAQAAGASPEPPALPAAPTAAPRTAHAPARLAGGVAALGSTRDGSRVLLVERQMARARMLQRADGRVLREWGWPSETAAAALAPGAQGSLAALAVSAEPGVLLAGRRDSTVVAYRLDNAQPAQVWRGHAQPVRAVAISGDGRRAASAGDDARVLWWDVAAGRLLRTVAAGAGIVDALALSADGAWLAAGAADGQVRVWETGTDRLVAHWDARAGAVRALAFAGGANWLACAGPDGTVTLWDLSTRTLARRLSATAPVAALGYADADGGVLMAGTEDGRLQSWVLGAGAAR